MQSEQNIIKLLKEIECLRHELGRECSLHTQQKYPDPSWTNYYAKYIEPYKE